MKWTQPSKKQIAAMSWWVKNNEYDYEGIIADGSIRAGKTLAMSVGFILWAMNTFEYCNFAICGKTVTSCRKNVIAPLMQALAGQYSMQYKHTENCLFIGTNRFYIYGGKDEGSQALIQGITLAGVLLDEVVLMPESFVNQATGRCSVEGSKFWFNCNPESPRHWFYTKWIRKAKSRKLLHLHFTMDDNPSMSDKIKQRYIDSYDGVFYERSIMGRWVAADGLIYRLFADNNNRYVIDDAQKYLTDTKQSIAAVLVGVDWGHGKSANAAVAIGITRNYKEIIVLDEFYTKDELDPKSLYDKLVPFIQNVIKQYGKCVVYGDNAEGMMVRGLSNSVKAAGLNASVHNCIKHEIIDRIVLENSLLARDRIKIHKNCKHLITALNESVWDPKSTKDERQDLNDGLLDSIDCLEYAFAPYMKQLETAGHLK